MLQRAATQISIMTLEPLNINFSKRALSALSDVYSFAFFINMLIDILVFQLVYLFGIQWGYEIQILRSLFFSHA